jgi:hypothetical protein
MKKVYFVSGASGSGKTAVINELKKINPNMELYDFDEIGVPKVFPEHWRKKETEKWLERVLKGDNDVCLLGQTVLGEILACPSINKLDKINYCLLDCSDEERARRLNSRGDGVDISNMLGWASWMREHCVNPQHDQAVIVDNTWEKLDFSSWQNLDSWHSVANVKNVDTTDMSIEEVAKSINKWMKKDINHKNKYNNHNRFKM